MKTYFLVAAAALVAFVAVPTPASALQCVPQSTDVSDELSCLTQHWLQCAGDLGETCNTVGGAVDGAIETVDDIEDLADNAQRKVHPGVDVYLP